jgi:hypothetical protein
LHEEKDHVAPLEQAVLVLEGVLVRVSVVNHGLRRASAGQVYVHHGLVVIRFSKQGLALVVVGEGHSETCDVASVTWSQSR